MSCGDRVKIVRETTGLTQAEFGEKLGFKLNKIRDIEIGKQKVSPEIALAIEKNFYISFRWLLIGDGPMAANQTQEGVALSPRAAALLDNYEALNEEDKRAFERMALTLAECQKITKKAA